MKRADANISSLVTFEGIAFISRPPTQIYFDGDDRLHNTSSPAIEFADGWKLHYVHGVYFSEDLFMRAFTMKNISSEEIIGLENAEQKAVLIPEFGLANILEKLDNMRLVDAQVRAFNNSENKVTYKLFEYDVNGVTGKSVRVEWIEKGRRRETLLGVPNSMTDSLEAVAWTLFKTREEYLNDMMLEA